MYVKTYLLECLMGQYVLRCGCLVHLHPFHRLVWPAKPALVQMDLSWLQK